MAEMGTEPDSESKIWRLTEPGFGVLVFGTGSSFGVNFSDSAHLCCPEIIEDNRMKCRRWTEKIGKNSWLGNEWAVYSFMA